MIIMINDLRERGCKSFLPNRAFLEEANFVGCVHGLEAGEKLYVIQCNKSIYKALTPNVNLKHTVPKH